MLSLTRVLSFPSVVEGFRRVVACLAGTGYFEHFPRYRLFWRVKPPAGCGVASVCRGRLTAGAEHTILSGLSLSRESGFFVSTCTSKPGSVLAIQDPPGEGGRPDLGQVFKYPALTCSEQAGQRPRTNFDSFLEDAMERYTGVSSSRLVKFPLTRGDCPACAGTHPAGHEWHCPVLSYLVSDFLAPGARLSIAQVGLVLDAVASFVAAMATDTPAEGDAAPTAGGVDGDGVISEGVA